MTTVSFPGLGLSFAINRVLAQIGPFTIYWYGLIVTCGIVLGISYSVWRGGHYGLNPDRMLDVTMWSVIVGILGARVYYVVFSWDYYKEHLDEIICIWNGGLAFYGGLIAGVLCAYILCRIWKVRLLRATDFALTSLLLGQGIGRWGNFVNVEAFGSYCTGIFRMVSPHIDSYFHQNPSLLPGFSESEVLAMSDIPVHPTFLYESCWLLLGFAVLALYTKRRKFDGELTILYFMWNGLGRMFIEGLRTDSLMLGGVRVSQVLAALMFAVSAFLYLRLRGQWKNGSLPACMDFAGAEAENSEADAASLTQDDAGEAQTDENPEPEDDVSTDAPEESAGQEKSDAQADCDKDCAEETGHGDTD